MRTPTAAELTGEIVALRRVGAAVASPVERRRLAHVIRSLRRRLGAAVPKRQAAAALGVSVQALDRWVAAGAIPVLRRPGSSREAIDAEALLMLAAAVEDAREHGEPRPLATALASLAERGGLPRSLRPNQRADDLRREFLHSTPDGRLRQAVELSRVSAALAANARARRTAGAERRA